MAHLRKNLKALPSAFVGWQLISPRRFAAVSSEWTLSQCYTSSIHVQLCQRLKFVAWFCKANAALWITCLHSPSTWTLMHQLRHQNQLRVFAPSMTWKSFTSPIFTLTRTIWLAVSPTASIRFAVEELMDSRRIQLTRPDVGATTDHATFHGKRSRIRSEEFVMLILTLIWFITRATSWIMEFGRRHDPEMLYKLIEFSTRWEVFSEIYPSTQPLAIMKVCEIWCEIIRFPIDPNFFSLLLLPAHPTNV